MRHYIIGLVVEFVVAIDEARVRFTDDASLFFFVFSFWSHGCDFVDSAYHLSEINKVQIDSTDMHRSRG
ncbi:hypothetical protein N7504_001716 [Penicillium tannophilum]|nr:hypothetical protein N7504_001716 [Penicillium tannophilum]